MWGNIYKITLGYGYQPQRTALFLAGLVIYSFLPTIMLGSHGALAQTDKTATPGRRCTMSQEINVAMDLGLPIGINSSLARQDCDVPKKQNLAAVWLTNGQTVLRAMAWACVLLLTAWFGGAVRKT